VTFAPEFHLINVGLFGIGSLKSIRGGDILQCGVCRHSETKHDEITSALLRTDDVEIHIELSSYMSRTEIRNLF
jgi:hypothetical protein